MSRSFLSSFGLQLLLSTTCILAVVLLVHVSCAAGQQVLATSNPLCMLNTCSAYAGTARQVSVQASAGSSNQQYCCSDSSRYPVLLGTPYTLDCTCSLTQQSYDAATGSLLVYFGEFATQGGCDSTSASPCSTCCVDAAPVQIWGTYSAATLSSSGVQHPDSLSLTASWNCAGQSSQRRTATVTYSPPPSGAPVGLWLLSSASSYLSMYYGQYYASNTFDLYTTGTPTSACAAPGTAQYNLLEQTANVAALASAGADAGIWDGFSPSVDTPSDCYRVISLQFYLDASNSNTAGASGYGVQVTYMHSTAVTSNVVWASQVAPVLLSAEPVTTTARLHMQLPADPSGVSHTLATTYAPGDSTNPVHPITLHGSNGMCNAAFTLDTAGATFRPAIGQFASFALRFFSATTSSTESEQTLANTCAVDPSSSSTNSDGITVTTVSGSTGSCIPWLGQWIVLQFLLDGTQGSFVLFEDSVCQVPTATTVNNVPAGRCQAQSYYDPSTHGYMSTLLEYGSTPEEASAALAAYYVQGTANSSTGSASQGNGGDTATPIGGEHSSDSSSSLPLTTIGLIVGGCTLLILALFLGWCCHDTCSKRSRAAAIHPTYTDQSAHIKSSLEQNF